MLPSIAVQIARRRRNNLLNSAKKLSASVSSSGSDVSERRGTRSHALRKLMLKHKKKST